MRKNKVLLGLVVFAILMLNSVSTLAAYTDDVTISSVTITSTTQAGFDAEAGLNFKFRFNDNYTTIKFYMFIKEDSSSAETIYSTTYTYSSYVNATSGTSGLVSVSRTLYIDEDDLSSGFEEDDNLIFYIYAYNSSIAVANLIDFDTQIAKYPFAVDAEETESGYSITTIVILLLVGVGGFVSVTFLLKYLSGKLSTSRDLIHVGPKKKPMYAKRRKDGSFSDIQDIGLVQKRGKPENPKPKKRGWW